MAGDSCYDPRNVHSSRKASHRVNRRCVLLLDVVVGKIPKENSFRRYLVLVADPLLIAISDSEWYFTLKLLC
jgi:hypothetical protein